MTALAGFARRTAKGDAGVGQLHSNKIEELAVALRIDDVDLVGDRALVERFQAGDPGAFDVLYTRYFARLTRFCRKRVGDHYDAEDIAQEAFTRALGALPTLGGERRFYPWMTVIAGRLCVDAYRRRSRTGPAATVDLGVIEGDQETVVDTVDVAILSEALSRIAPRHREVLDLREQQGWSYQQIADHYDVTFGTVEALLFRARRALRREFLAGVGDESNWRASRHYNHLPDSRETSPSFRTSPVGRRPRRQGRRAPDAATRPVLQPAREASA